MSASPLLIIVLILASRHSQQRPLGPGASPLAPVDSTLDRTMRTAVVLTFAVAVLAAVAAHSLGYLR